VTSDDNSAILEAAIQHLEDLRRLGVRYLALDPSLQPAEVGPLAAPENAAKPIEVGEPNPAEPRPDRAATAIPLPTTMPPSRSSAAAAPAACDLFDSTAKPSALDPAAKVAAMDELRQRVLPCQKCPHLAAARKTVVFGVGDPNASLLFVGEAPGADEDEQGEPFVGKAGQLLTRIIRTMGLAREAVYIANILKCRPDTPGQSAGNRKPTLDEMRTCQPYLLEQIDIIQPKVIVALGATAIEGLLGKTEGITRLRGQWRSFRGIPLMPTYHPAYLLRNQALSEKRKVWEDMLKVMERLGLSITDKQRGYFL
jgi:DNA polymerase